MGGWKVVVLTTSTKEVLGKQSLISMPTSISLCCDVENAWPHGHYLKINFYNYSFANPIWDNSS